MNKTQVRVFLSLGIWTLTLLAWAQWAHWAPYWGRPNCPSKFESLQFNDISYKSESGEWRLLRYNTEGFKQKLRSGRPIDTFILSSLKINISDLDHRITRESIPGVVLHLLDKNELIKYRPVHQASGSNSLATESRVQMMAPEPLLEPADLHRLNKDLLSSWYPLEFEKFPAKPLNLLTAPTQQLGFLHLKFHFKAQSDESGGVLFQTANGNQGIRLEQMRALSGTTGLKVIAGWKGARAGLNLGPANELVLSTEVDPDQEHSVEIRLDSWGDLSAFFDGTYIGKIDQRQPLLNNVMVGNGYDGYHPFWGNLHVDSLELSALQPGSLPLPARWGLAFWFGLLLAIANTLALIYLIRYLFWLE